MADFSAFLKEEHAEFLVVKDNRLKPSHLDALLAEYKEIAVRNVIDQFGVGTFINVYKEGGNVTTLHNAKNDVFATSDDKNRFTYQYNRKEKRTKDMYDSKLPGMRKAKFQSGEQVVDAYTGQELPKDGRAHIDHVVGASKIQKKDEARLYMSDKERGEMATTSTNLAWADGRMNQSKNDKDLSEWMDDSGNKNVNGEKNAERFGVNRDQANAINNKAKENIEREIKQKKKEYYVEKIRDTSLVQGHELGKRQAIGYLMYEFQNALFREMKSYFKQYKSYKTITDKIRAFTNACQRVAKEVASKIKGIGSKYLEGFAGGVIGNIVTIFINTFATTAKNMVRVLNEGIQGLIRAFVLLVKRPNDMTLGEAAKESTKIVAAAVSTAIGVGLTESFILYLKTTPVAAFASIVGGILGGILTGVVTATIVYAIDNMGAILKDLAEVMDTITYNFKVSADEIRARYEKVLEKIDEEYSKVLERICQEYEKLYTLTKKAYDATLAPEEQFHNTTLLAAEMKVSSEKMLSSKRDIVDFFK